MDLRRELGVQVVSLEGLDEAETAALAEPIAPIVAPEFSSRLHAITGGNPFFMEEVLHSLRDTGELPYTNAALDAVGVPRAVSEVIERRVRRLGRETQDILTVAAVAGTEFSLDVMERLFDVQHVLDALDAAHRAGLVSEVGSGDRFRFTHAATRDTLYRLPMAARRSHTHYRIAGALEAVSSERPVDPAQLSYHYFYARGTDRLAKTVEYAERAGERASASLAYEDAAKHYRRAVTALRDFPSADPLRLCRLVICLAESLEHSHDIEESREQFSEAARIAHDHGEAEILARAALGFSNWHRYGTVDTEAVAWLERALDALEPGPDHLRLRVRVTSALALRLDPATMHERRRALFRDAIETARSVDDPFALAECLRRTPDFMFEPSGVEERLTASAELLRLASRTGDSTVAAWGHANRAQALLELGNRQAAEHNLVAYEERAAQLHEPWFAWHVLVLRSTTAALAGRFTESEQAATEARLIEREHDPSAPETRTIFNVMLAQVRGRPRDVDERDIAACIERYPQHRVWQALRARHLGASGRIDEAAGALDGVWNAKECTPCQDQEWLSTIAFSAEACEFIGDPRLATQLYRLLEPFGAVNVVTTRGIAYWGSVSRHLAILATAAGRLAAAEQHFQRAVARDLESGAEAWALQSARSYVDAVAQHSDPAARDRADRALDHAIARAESAGVEDPVAIVKRASLT